MDNMFVQVVVYAGWLTGVFIHPYGTDWSLMSMPDDNYIGYYLHTGTGCSQIIDYEGFGAGILHLNEPLKEPIPYPGAVAEISMRPCDD